jgi:hypothetical protein
MAILFQYTTVGKNNMVEVERLLQTFDFSWMTSSIV